MNPHKTECIHLQSIPQNTAAKDASIFPVNRLSVRDGVIQTLTEHDLADSVFFRVRWRGGLLLTLSRRFESYWILVEKDDTVFQCVRVDKEHLLIQRLQQVIRDIERGRFARTKTTAELVAQIVQERQLTSCMNNTKWDCFRNAMINEMPFCPPYEIKTLFDDDTSFITNFIASDIWYQGNYDAEEFVNLNYKVIEYLAVKPKYYENKGGLLAPKKIWHNAEETFAQILYNCHIPCKKCGDACLIYGYL